MKKRIQFICLYMLLVITSNLWALPVTNGLVIYLDAGTITGVADGGAISTWSDISGLGNDVRIYERALTQLEIKSIAHP